MDKSLEIGLQLKALRKAANLTQKQVAEKIGKDASYISHIENGKNISVEVLEYYCTALGVSFELIFTYKKGVIL